VAPLGGNPITGRIFLAHGFHAWGLISISIACYKNMPLLIADPLPTINRLALPFYQDILI
jgi:hypothetical protein